MSFTAVISPKVLLRDFDTNIFFTWKMDNKTDLVGQVFKKTLAGLQSFWKGHNRRMSGGGLQAELPLLAQLASLINEAAGVR